jgi:hypothetical protein
MQFNEEDERSLEDLVRELNISSAGGSGGEKREGGGWNINQVEEKDIGRLVRDVRVLLPDVKKSIDDRGEGGAGVKRKEDIKRGEEIRKEEITDWER